MRGEGRRLGVRIGFDWRRGSHQKKKKRKSWANQGLQTAGNKAPIFLASTWNNGMEMKSPLTERDV
jgi:hypothetical protein